MTVEILFPFTESQNYIFDSNKITISNGIVKPALINNPDQETTQEFTSPTDFVYDNTKTKFDNLISDTLFGANYDTDINANFSEGNGIGTAYGGATILDGYLDLSYNDVRYVDYNGASNIGIQKGTIKLKFKAPYSDSPPATNWFFLNWEGPAGFDNTLGFWHDTNAGLKAAIFDKNGTLIFQTEFAKFYPVVNTIYEIAFCYDLDNGRHRIFLDGIQQGSTEIAYGIRDSNIAVIRIGSGYSGTAKSNSKISDLIIFDKVLYIENYTPGYTVPNSNPIEKITQIDQRPNGAMAYASYNINENFSWSNGNQTGTLVGGATIENGKLNLKGGTSKYVTYDADQNADTPNKGCIREEYIPDYSNDPPSTQYLFSISTGNNIQNLITLLHDTNGQIILTMYDNVGIPISNTILGIWSPIQGQKYVIELNWNIKDFFGGQEATRLFIDGSQFGTTIIDSATRTNPTSLKIGASYNGTSASRHEVDNFIIFNDVQHTSDHTEELPYSYEETIYLTDTITLPTFVYTGPGAVQLFTNFQTTEFGYPRFQINGKYWNGSIWITSDNSYSQMNDAATILTNILSAPKQDINNIIKMSFPNSNSNLISSVYELILTCTTQLYTTENPIIEPTTELGIEELEGFFETVSKSGLDDVRWILKRQNDWVYWNGSNWINTNFDYSQTSSANDINSNKASFTSVGIKVRVRGYLHSEDGLTAPELSELKIQYNFHAGFIEEPEKCVVFGYMFDENADPLPGVKIIIELDKNSAIYSDDSYIFSDQIEVESDNDGYWDVELINTVNMNAKWNFILSYENKKTSYSSISVPNQISVNFSELIT